MLWGGGHRGSFVVTPRRTDIATTRIGSEPAREGRKAGGGAVGRGRMPQESARGGLDLLSLVPRMDEF